jgi:signal transduction histidine kinase
VETDPSLEVPYLLNRQVLEQSLDNLLINAAKYSSPEDPIRIRGTFEPSLISCEDPRRGIGFLQVRVRDFGIGVPEADRPRLFEPFHRGSNVGTIRGTGLGLALVRAWVEGAGGIVGYETPSGGGSIFRIDLPAIPERGKTEARLVRTGLLGVAEKTGVE